MTEFYSPLSVTGRGQSVVARSNNSTDLSSIADSSHVATSCSCWLIGSREWRSTSGLLSCQLLLEAAEFSGWVRIVRLPIVGWKLDR